MKFIVIGVTDNPQPWFPPDVLAAIRRGRVFSGGRRHHELVAPLLPEGAEWIDITVPLEGVFRQYASRFARQASASVVVFASGDPLFFGFANTLRRQLPEAEMELYPAFNSLQLLAHRLLLPYHDLRVVSLTGRPWTELDRALIERSPKIGLLTDREHTPAAIAQRLTDYGYTYYKIHAGEHLGNPALERVTTLSPEEAAGRRFEQPNCVILEQCAAMPPKPFGLPDTAFALLDGREKMITKMPVRLLTLQALDLPRRHVLWDIGFCTGSVSIEARLQFPQLQVVAFEVRPECEALMQENCRRFGVPGIETVIGDFVEMRDERLLTPDAVFIGGHGGRLREVMAKAARHIAPGGVMVMNSVTSAVVERLTDHRPSSRQLWDKACEALGLKQEPPLRLQLNDYNPIEILKCSK